MDSRSFRKSTQVTTMTNGQDTSSEKAGKDQHSVAGLAILSVVVGNYYAWFGDEVPFWLVGILGVIFTGAYGGLKLARWDKRAGLNMKNAVRTLCTFGMFFMLLGDYEKNDVTNIPLFVAMMGAAGINAASLLKGPAKKTIGWFKSR